MATQNRFNCLSEDIDRKVHNFSADTLKLLLTNVAPVATNTVKANLTEIAPGNGYVAGGATVPTTAETLVGAQSRISGGNVTITASGGTIGPFRYGVLYNSTPAAGNLISWIDLGSNITLNSGENELFDLTTNTPFMTVG